MLQVKFNEFSSKRIAQIKLPSNIGGAPSVVTVINATKSSIQRLAESNGWDPTKIIIQMHDTSGAILADDCSYAATSVCVVSQHLTTGIQNEILDVIVDIFGTKQPYRTHIPSDGIAFGKTDITEMACAIGNSIIQKNIETVGTTPEKKAFIYPYLIVDDTKHLIDRNYIVKPGDKILIEIC